MVRYEVADEVATITLDSPANRNALSLALITQLTDAIRGASDNEAVRAIMLAHTGPVFCAGADLKESTAGGKLPVEALPELLMSLWESPKPVIARVAGAARGGGIGLLAAADIAVCTHDATFAFTEVRLGVVAASISAVVLRRLGTRAASDLMLTGRVVDGAHAQQVGLVTRTVAHDELDVTVADYIDAVRHGEPHAIAEVKHVINRSCNLSRDELAELTHLSAWYFRSAEAAEGIAALQEKRPPAWFTG